MDTVGRILCRKDKPKPGKKDAKQLEVKEAEVSKTEIKNGNGLSPDLLNTNPIKSSTLVFGFFGLQVLPFTETVSG